MRKERWTEVRRLAERILQSPEEEWPRLLDALEGSDVELRADVEKILEGARGVHTLSRGPEGDVSAPPLGEQVGENVGRYKLLRLLGEGGFGTVWLAEQREPLRRRVALKILKPGMDSRPILARFDAERQVLALMDHANIAKVFDAGATKSGRPYVVMEWIQGLPITDYCDSERLSTRERLTLFKDVCSAIQHAHQKGIIHRDIKPSNVLVSLEDGRAVVKVIDFGIAKALERPMTEMTFVTELRQILGTPDFMAPEQAGVTHLDVDTRADIYSLGVLLYELLTGKRPFEMKTLLEEGFEEILRHIKEVDPPKPSTRVSSEGDHSTLNAERRRLEPQSLKRLLRGDLDWIVMKALEKERSRRYATAAAFSDDIDRYLDQAPVTARPPSALYRTSKFVRRYRGQAAAAALLLMSLVGGLVGTLLALNQASEERNRAQKHAEDAERNARDARDAEKESRRFQRQAEYERDRARDAQKAAESRRLAGEARRVMEDDGALALMLARRSYEVAPSVEGYGALFEALAQTRELVSRADVESMAFCPRGSYWATWGKRGALLFEAELGEEIAPLAENGERVWECSFSPDGRRILTRESNAVKVWDTSGRLLARIPRKGQAHFVGQGEEIVTLTYEGYVDFWNSASGERIGGWRSPRGKTRKWHAATQSVLRLDNRAGRLSIYDGRSGELCGSVELPSTRLSRTMRVPSAGKGLFLDPGGVVDLEGMTYHRLQEGSMPLLYGEEVFTVEGSSCLIGLDPHRPALIDVISGETVRVFEGHRSQVVDCAWSPDGARLLTASFDGTARLWEVESGETQYVFRSSVRQVDAVDFCADGSLAVVTQYFPGTLGVFGLDDGEPRGRIRCTDAFTRVCVSKDGRRALTRSNDGVVRLWMLDDHRLGRRLEPSPRDTLLDRVPDFRLGPGGKILVISSTNQCSVFDLETGQELLSLSGHESPVMDARWSPDGKFLATATWDGERYVGTEDDVQHFVSWDGQGDDDTLRTWDATTGVLCDSVLFWANEAGEPVAEEPFQTMGFSRICWSEDGERIGAADAAGRVFIWRPSSSESPMVGGAVGPGAWVHELAFLGSDLLIAADKGIEEGQSTPWLERRDESLSSGTPFEPSGHSRWRMARLSPTKEHFVGIDQLGTLRAWDCDSGDVVLSGAELRIAAHEWAGNGEWGRGFSTASFSADGKYLAAAGPGSDTSRVFVIDMETKDVVRIRTEFQVVLRLAVDSTKGQLVVASNLGRFELWDWKSSRLMARHDEDGSPLERCEFSDDGRYLIFATAGGRVRVLPIDIVPLARRFEMRTFTLEEYERYGLMPIESLVETRGILEDELLRERAEQRLLEADIPSELRAAAMAEVGRRVARPTAWVSASWNLVRDPGRSEGEYAYAFELAEAARSSWRGEDGDTRIPLAQATAIRGLAQLRLGRLEAASESQREAKQLILKEIDEHGWEESIRRGALCGFDLGTPLIGQALVSLAKREQEAADRVLTEFEDQWASQGISDELKVVLTEVREALSK